MHVHIRTKVRTEEAGTEKRQEGRRERNMEEGRETLRLKSNA